MRITINQAWRRRTAAAAALATGAVFAASGAAVADNIQDTIADDGSGVVLTAGSATGGTASVRLIGNSSSGDTDPNCNIDAGEAPLVLDVVTPTGVSANPDPVSITACGADYAITFTADASAVSGTATVSVVSGPAGGGSYMNQVSIPITVQQPVVVTPADTTAPEISYTVSPATPNGSNGWYTGTVDVDWTVTEAESPDSLVTNGCDDVTINADQAATTYTCSASSDGGTAVPVTTEAIKRDGNAPTALAFTGGPTGPVYFGDTVPSYGCTADGGVSGLDSCTVSGGGTSLGSHTVTATATDGAGNQATTTTSYTVLAWTLKGFYAPVDGGGVYNTVKGGSTVPFKFEMFAGDRELTATSDVTSFTATKVNCIAGTTEDAVETFSTTGATSLRYDTTGGQFIQNWKVPTGAGTCYRVVMTARDSSSVSALFKVK